MELYLVRHTTPQIAAGICYGHAELDVTDEFAFEAAQVCAKLQGLAPVAFYSSPQLRCRRLADALALNLGLDPAVEDERLKELHFGAWEMLAWDDIPRDALAHWGDRFVEMPPPGGESFNDLYRRAAAFFEECATHHQGPVLAVSHAGVIRALLAHALNLPLQHVPNFHLDYGGVTKLMLAPPYVKVAYVNR